MRTSFIDGWEGRVRALLTFTCLLTAAACGDDPAAIAPAATPGATVAGSPALMPTGVAAAPVAEPSVPSPTGVMDTAAAGAGALSPGGALAGAPLAGAAAMVPDHPHDECVDPTPAALEDSMITDMPEIWTSPSGAVELVLPKPVQSWMDERLFKEGHDGWHAVRRCGFLGGLGGGGRPTTGSRAAAAGSGGGAAGSGGGRTGGGRGFGFPGAGGGGIQLSPAFALCEKPELAPAEQECGGPIDGYEFLVVHRHMINVLRQAFPAHPEMFAGFTEFPFDAQDVPMQWRDRFGTGWSPQIIEVATQLDDIENQLERFPTEGELGQFIQCGGMASGASSVHGAMHFKWAVSGSPYMLGDSTANLGNYMFWKLHGWIDNVWTRYRAAKGLKDDDPQHVAALVDQCREMHEEGAMIGPVRPATGSTQPLPEEAGVFHEQVRPILETTCAGCHSGGSPEAGLVLGGQVSSAAIVGNLVDVQAVRGGQFKRVVARNPMQSWLYLKAAGMAVNAGCTGMCNNQVMPPTGMVTLTTAELGTIQRWIMDGAAAPTMP
jgi:hypothetical protein